MKKIKILFLAVSLLTLSAIHAQKPDSMLNVYHDNFQQEKIYLHFDKSIYNTGETIWFKTYLMAGESLSDYSRNVYADWYNDSGMLIQHVIMPVFESSARGQFDIPSAYHGKSLHVKVYTGWMLNFDSAFFFHKDISVMQPSVPASVVGTLPAISIHFFPEGGDLLEGINTVVGFMVTDQAGKPVDAKGAILNSSGEMIDSFATVYDGMGKFYLEPMQGQKYFCNWVDQYGTVHYSALPDIKNTGAVIEAKLSGGKLLFGVRRTAEAKDNLKNMHLVASMNQQPLYNAALYLANSKSIAGSIETGNMPTGVLLLSLFDADWIPVSERIVFVNNGRYRFFPEVNILSSKLQKRGLNEFIIHVEDSVLSNMSFAATDADLYCDSSSNIFSRMLLSAELKGNINNPAYYFSDAPGVTDNLDLVMLTHGWRKIRWDDIIKERAPRLVYGMDSDYLQIRGKVYTSGQATITSGQTITLIMQSKDSSRQYFLLPLSADGSFRQRGIIFYDTARLFYQINGTKQLKDIAVTRFQGSSLSLTPLLRGPKNTYGGPDTLLLRYNNRLASDMQKSRRLFDTAATTLKEVTVISKVKTPMELLDEKYTTGVFSSNNGYAFDVANDQTSQGALDLFHYLQFKIPGLSMSLPILGANGSEDANSANTPGLNWRDGTPTLFLNEMQSDAQSLMGIQMSDVSYIKVFRPPFMMSTGSSPSGAIAVYTKKPSEIRYQQLKGLNTALLSGYTAYHEFYSPDYTASFSKLPDLRTTLYWNPYVLTDKNKKTVTVSFYNNDHAKKIRLVLEGVNAAGKMARVEKIIE